MFFIKDLICQIQHISHSSLEGVSVTGLCSSSEKVSKGCAFFCIKGRKADGDDYINIAIQKGAAVIISESAEPRDGAIFITVKDARSAYARALSKMYGEPSGKMKIIALTGTNGKTTVSQMIGNALKLSGKRCALIGTLGAEFEGEITSLEAMTTPDPEVLYALLDKYARAGAEYVVMEASSHALALRKLDGIDFKIGAITNMSAEHLDFHGDMDSYYKAKSMLFERCERGVFLCDDFYTAKMFSEAKCQKTSCSVSDKRYDLYAENIGYSFENGTVFTVLGNGFSLPLHSDIPAEFTVSNALLACAVLRELGLNGAQIYKGISTLKGISGRMERVETGRDFSVFIDFAHTPDALSRLLTSVKRLKRPEQRIVTLFGCGGDRDKSKRSLMGAVASHLSDMVIITADNSRSEDTDSIITQIMTGVDKSRVHIRIDDREKAIEYAIMNAGTGDIILLCGKGHEEYEITKQGSRPFFEKEIVRKALQKRKAAGI